MVNFDFSVSNRPKLCELQLNLANIFHFHKEQNSLECPGSSMQMCFMACPSMPAEVFGACVGECAKRCDNP